MPAGHQFGLLADHLVGRVHHGDAERDCPLGNETEAEVVGQEERRSGTKSWRLPQADDNLRARHRQALSRSNVKRDALPSPRIEVKPESGEGLDLRIGGDAALLAVAAKLPTDDVLGLPEQESICRTFTFSSRIDSLSILAGGSHRQIAQQLEEIGSG